MTVKCKLALIDLINGSVDSMIKNHSKADILYVNFKPLTILLRLLTGMREVQQAVPNIM